MKILLVVDGASYSDVVIKMLEALRLPPPTGITVLTVVPQHAFLAGIILGRLKRYRGDERGTAAEGAPSLIVMVAKEHN